MTMFSFILLLFIALWTVSPQVETSSCDEALQNVEPVPGAYVPMCNLDGSWQVKQCHMSTGDCWCVTQDGKEILGTRKGPGAPGTVGGPDCRSCAVKRARAKVLPGSFVPSCKADGSFEDKQCDASTGHCWCVKDDGYEIQGTRKAPGGGELNCDPCIQGKFEPKPGTPSCLAYFVNFYYDQETKSCKEFVYGGCGGNANNFMTKEECMARCG